MSVKSASPSGVRVRLLADVKGQGKKGDIVFVSPAMFTNVLQPKRSAEKVSDQEIEQAAKNAAKIAADELANALDLSAKLKAMETKFEVKRKVGANNQLFGSVSTKQIIEHIREIFPINFAATTPGSSIHLLVTEIKHIPQAGETSTGQELVHNEIRKSGVYKAILKLHPKVDGEFNFVVVPEKK
jgi:large subunit ribosomal protein L9